MNESKNFKFFLRYHLNLHSLQKYFPRKNFSKKLFFPAFSLSVYFSDKKEVQKFINSLKEFRSFIFIKENNFLALFGDLNVFSQLADTLLDYPAVKKKLKKLIVNYHKVESYKYEIGPRIFDGNHKYVMGILNVTDDSFFDGGKYSNHKKAFQRVKEMLESGVDIIDIGGESTRPGSTRISASEELRRVLPSVEFALNAGAIVSVDTYKSEVAEECLKLGAHIINDISGFKFDANIPIKCKEYNSAVVLMHIRGTPETMQLNPYYDDPVQEIISELDTQLKLANKVALKKIFIDPGIGFGKRLKDNYEILQRIEELKFLGYPILIGLSRKSLIGKLLDIPVEERLTGTIATNAVSLLKGVNVIRVHDVKEAIQVKKIIEAIENPESINNV